MKVLSQIARQGDPRFLQAAQGDYWFWRRGYQVVQFEPRELEAGFFDEDLNENAEHTIVFGALGVIHQALGRVNRPVPPRLEFPSELTQFVGPAVRECTMGDLRTWERTAPDRFPLHIEPRDRKELFEGQVVRVYGDFIPLSDIPDDEPIKIHNVVKIESTWRAMILRGRVLTVAQFKGNPLAQPDPQAILAAIDSYRDAPIGYGMDWAVTSEGKTVLLEVNDGISLANYGVPGHDYSALVECRWRELMGLEDNEVEETLQFELAHA